MAEPLEPLLDYDDVRHILGVARSTVQELEKRGFLARVDIPMKGVRFRREDVARVIRRHRAAIPDASGFRMTELQADSTDYPGIGPATPEESHAALQEETNAANRQAEVWPVDGEVRDDSDS